MYEKIKEAISVVRQEKEHLEEVEDSLLLAKFFYDFKRLLIYYNAISIEAYPTQKEVDLRFKYTLYYDRENGFTGREFLFGSLKMSYEELNEPEYLSEFEKVIDIVKKNNVKLKSIKEKTTVDDFLNLFDPKYKVNYLKYFLEESLLPNENVKRVKTKI